MRVFLDDLTNPVLTISLDLSSLLRLDNGSAWVGFTAGTGAAWENHDIVSWQFGPAGVFVTPTGPFPVTATPSTPTTGTAPMTFVFPSNL
jgi:hypothetical protein